MPGFFRTIQAINDCSAELLNEGRELAVRFKNGDLEANEYEAQMIGKIHELVNSNAKSKDGTNDDELEKLLVKVFSNPAIESLKDGVKSYIDSLQNAGSVEDLDEAIDEESHKTVGESLREENDNSETLKVRDVLSSKRKVGKTRKSGK